MQARAASPPCCSASPVSRSSPMAGRDRPAACFSAARTPPRRWCSSTDCASVRRPPARRPWRRSRWSKSSASRYCEGPRRAFTAPMRSAASSRYSRARGQTRFAANAGAGYGSYATSSVFGGVSGSGADGAWRYALQAGHRQSDGFNAIFNAQKFQLQPRPRRLPQRQRQREPRLSLCARTGDFGAGVQEPPQCPVRRRTGLR